MVDKHNDRASAGLTVDERQRLGGRIRQLTRWHGPDAPQTIEAKQDLAEAQIEAAIAKILEDSPPLRPEQVYRLGLLLSGDAR